MYGQPPSVIPSYKPGTTKVESMRVLKSNLEASQCRMKVQHDKKRKERSFEVGDWVYLRLVPYLHKSLASHSFHKLQPHFYGPFEILAKIGVVAYKLKLPDSSKLHPVFHVSCLKKHLGSTVHPTIPLHVITEVGILFSMGVLLGCQMAVYHCDKCKAVIMELLDKGGWLRLLKG
ncbi:unnamed protein product [Malus baccata var. baccata]